MENHHNRKLRKSKDQVITGVAGGMAEFFGWPTRRMRTVWLLVAFFSGGTAVIVYLVCHYLFPPPTDFNINHFRQQ